MILQIVTFPLTAGLSEEAILADAHATVGRWQAEGELVSKTFSRRDDGALQGLYLWTSRQRAEETHDAAWVAKAVARMGVTPQISYSEVFMILDNEHGTLREWPLSVRA